MGAAAAGCGKAPALTSGTHTLRRGGTTRSNVLNVPADYHNAHPYRLTFAFHWLSGTAADVVNMNYHGLLPQTNNSTVFVASSSLYRSEMRFGYAACVYSLISPLSTFRRRTRAEARSTTAGEVSTASGGR